MRQRLLRSAVQRFHRWAALVVGSSLSLWLALSAAAQSSPGLIARWTFNTGTPADLIDEISGYQLTETGYSSKQTTTFNPNGTITLGEGRLLAAAGLNATSQPALATGFTIWARMRVNTTPVTSVGAALGFINSPSPTANAQENLLAATLNIQNTLVQRFRGNLANGYNLAQSNPSLMNKLTVGTDFSVSLTFSDAGPTITYSDRVNGVSVTKTEKTPANFPSFQCFALGRLVREGYANLTFDEVHVYNRVLSPAELDALQPSSMTLPVDEFFLAPDKAAIVQIQTNASATLTALNYTITNYAGATVASGICPSSNGIAQLPLTLSAGYYELNFSQLPQVFGLCALPEFTGAADPFFCMDSALTLLETRSPFRAKLVRWMKRGGVAMARERINWDEINPAASTYDFQTVRNVQALLETYASTGLPVLDMFLRTPVYAGKTDANPFPSQLNATNAAWNDIGAHYAPLWQGLEIWNEPDISFGGEMPADQYAPLLKAIDYSFTLNNINVPVGGGVFANYSPFFVKQSIDNGVLNHSDFVSFHNYFRAITLEGTVRNFRTDLANAGLGLEAMPLWITECGMPWAQGTKRPLFDQDLLSSLEITSKAIEARATGIKRYFPFIFTYFPEDKNNFGMLGKELSPLRSTVAYFQAIRRLASKPYVGDLTHAQDASVKTARVFDFQDGRQSVIALYTGVTGAAQAAAVCRPDLPAIINSIEGADGRILQRAGDGAIPIPDGLTYVYVDTASLGAALVTNSPTKGLWNLGQQPLPARAAPSPVILQYVFDPALVTVHKRGYQITGSTAPAVPILLRLHNLASVVRNVSVTLTLESGAPQTLSTTVAANSTADLPWTVNLGAFLSTKDSTKVTFTGTDQTGGLALSPLALTFSQQRELAEYLTLFPLSTRIDVTDLTRWERNITSIGMMTMSINSSNNWQLDLTFSKEGDRWAYPRFTVLPALDRTRATGLILRARSTGAGNIRIGVQEADGSSYITTFAVIPADGQFHSQLVRFEEIAPGSGSAPDENGQLDPTQIFKLLVGMSSTPATNTLEVSDIYLVNE